MNEYICERVIREARYICETGATVRTAAQKFGVSKSTVHKDVTERLKAIDRAEYSSVKEVLQKNLSERAVRGGMATKSKYAAKKKIS